MPYPELFWWWAITITFGSVFLMLVSGYLYIKSIKERQNNHGTQTRASKLVGNFVFVWILMGLLAMYIASINLGSSILFAAGNVVVEVILLIYTIKNRTRNSH